MRPLLAADARCAEPLRRRALTRRLICDDDLPAELIDELWQGDADRLVYAGAPLQVKDRSIVARLEYPAGRLLVKRHTWGRWSRTLRMAWRVPTARRCWQLGRLLAEQGIATPRPRACVEYRLGPIGYRSYLLTDYIEGESLYRLLRSGTVSVDVAERLAEQVVEIWERLADLGICHNDYKPENFIVDAAERVWLIDLERVRCDRDAVRRLRRQVEDVRTFLHVRSWRHSVDLHDVFQRAFSGTAAGEWLRTSGADGRMRNADGEREDINPRPTIRGPNSPGLSVLVMCDDDSDDNNESVRRSIDSVRDIADEILVVVPSASDGEDRLDAGHSMGEGTAADFGTLRVPGIADWSSSPVDPQSNADESPASSTTIAHPWVLVLRADECVTPDLAREVQERIADAGARAAYRVPIGRLYFGRRVTAGGERNGLPVRLFHRKRCAFSLADGEPAYSVASEQTGKLSKRIDRHECASVAKFIARLNERTSRAAEERLQRGERARLAPAMLRACRQFLKSYLIRGGIRDGWVGLQINLVEAVFTWLEEAKLRQLSAEFRPQGQYIGEDADAPPILSALDGADRPVVRSKAA